MTLGMIVRADQGGLGVQTWEAWRHLQPDVTVVMLAGARARGLEYAGKYDAGRVLVTGLGDPVRRAQALAEMARLVDTIYTVETVYDDSLYRACRRQGTQLVVHANPELLDPNLVAAARSGLAHLWLPTEWRRDWIVGELGVKAKIVEQPVALDRFDAGDLGKRRLGDDHLPTFVHPCAPAYQDRAGTELVLATLPLLRDVAVVFKSWPLGVPFPKVELHDVDLTVEQVTTDDYYDAWPLGDWLLHPRRFGGLSLPLLEASALGMPAVTLDREPERYHAHVLRVKAHVDRTVRMKGGDVAIYDTSPPVLAEAISWAAARPADEWQWWRIAAHDHARRAAWDGMVGRRFRDALAEL